jgi:carbon starvation protein CstA
MITFLVSCALLGLAYVVYGSFLERYLGVDSQRPVPCDTHFDGVDYVPLPWHRALLIQLLNIAGLGPVFGAVMGALFGPVAFVWIVFGGIFIGAVHDFTAAFVSMREGGASLTTIIGTYLGQPVRLFMTGLTLVLLVLVGVAFVLGPARILADLCGSGTVQTAAMLTPETVESSATGSLARQTATVAGGQVAAPNTLSQGLPQATSSPTEAASPLAAVTNTQATTGTVTATAATPSPAAPFYATTTFWAGIIFMYYILATLLPIDQLIGRIYPVFGGALLIKAFLVTGLIVTGRLIVPELTFANLHPEGAPIWPVMMITIACGAVSGFHATQSPMMARVLTSERYARPVFFGAMLIESFIALVWAAAAMGFAKGNTGELARLLGPKGDAVVIVKSIGELLGVVGVPLVLLGVVALPITTGDTAFRSARLIIADALGFEQKSLHRRFLICIPLFLAGLWLCQMDFKVIWKYFAWLNQCLSVFTLWAVTVWLKRQGKSPLLTGIPAVFMSMAVLSYILSDAKTGFGLSMPISLVLSGSCAAVFAIGANGRTKLGTQASNPSSPT